MTSCCAAAEPASRRRARPQLGTFVEISAFAGEVAMGLEEIDAAIDRAFAAVARVEREMSCHDSESALGRANRRAHREAVELPVWTTEVLGRALELARRSGGAFDPTVGRFLVADRFLPRPEKGFRYSGGSFREIELTRHADGTASVRYARPLVVDLGGIAKGFAVDRALDGLRDAGLRGGVVNAGGDLAVFGAASIAVELRDPARPRATLQAIELANGALATSGGYLSRRRRRGAWRSALVDPRSGESFVGLASVTVTAPRCVDADALTKIAFVAPERFAEIAAPLGAAWVDARESGRAPERSSEAESRASESTGTRRRS